MPQTATHLDDPLSALTARELRVLELTARGLTNGAAAAELGVTAYAVKYHLGSIYRKLGVNNRTEAAVLYSEQRRRAPAPVQEGDS